MLDCIWVALLFSRPLSVAQSRGERGESVGECCCVGVLCPDDLAYGA